MRIRGCRCRGLPDCTTSIQEASRGFGCRAFHAIRYTRYPHCECPDPCPRTGIRHTHVAVFLSSPAPVFNALRAAPGGLLSARRGLAVPAAAAASAPAVAAAPADASKVVTKAHGFTLQRQQFVKEYGSTVLLYKHDKTGA